MHIVLIVVSTFMFSSCASHYQHPHAGYYRSHSGEWIIIEKDGAVSWTDDDNFITKDWRMGTLYNPDKKGKTHFIMLSSSPYAGTTIEVNEDKKLLKVNWYDARPNTKVKFASEYHKREN